MDECARRGRGGFGSLRWMLAGTNGVIQEARRRKEGSDNAPELLVRKQPEQRRLYRRVLNIQDCTAHVHRILQSKYGDTGWDSVQKPADKAVFVLCSSILIPA